MRKLLVFMAVFVFSFASSNMGAYFGDMKAEMKSFFQYPSNNYASASLFYLEKHDISIPQYISTQKKLLIKKALIEAKKLAEKTNEPYYAIDNLKFDVKITKDYVYIFLDYNVIAFDR